MSLIKRNFPNFSAFNDFFDDAYLRSKFTNENWLPAVNVSDNEDGYEIEVAAPGMKKEDFKISVENGLLTISAESKTEEEEKGKNYTRKEFHSSSFLRSFTLPGNVSEDQIQATYEDGVLRLKLGKMEIESPRQKMIDIA